MIESAAVPMLSVIVPTFNRAWSIARCLDSLLVEASHVAMEVLVVDDGSTDATVRALEAYGSEIKVLRQPNSGPSAARNAGVRASSGALLAFMDSDDENVPGRLRMQVDYMMLHKEVVLTFGAIAFRSRPLVAYLSTLEVRDGWATMADPYRHLLTSGGECVNTMTAMVRRECFERVGGFNPSYRCAEDTDLWPRLGELGPFAYHGRPMALVNDTRVEEKISRIQPNLHGCAEGDHRDSEARPTTGSGGPRHRRGPSEKERRDDAAVRLDRQGPQCASRGHRVLQAGIRGRVRDEMEPHRVNPVSGGAFVSKGQDGPAGKEQGTRRMTIHRGVMLNRIRGTRAGQPTITMKVAFSGDGPG